MVTISNADKALKTFYLGVLADQLNVGINPFFAKIEHTSADVWGKEIKKLAPYGINGGIGSGAETDTLPQSAGNNYAQFTLTLKNLYGKIELSDKAIRASQNSAGAFVNLLNAEMDGLLKASKFNFGRMLYGNGLGILTRTVANTQTSKNKIVVASTKNLMEGMRIDFYTEVGALDPIFSGTRIVSIDRENNIVTCDKNGTTVYGAGCYVFVQGSKSNEITGLEAIFGTSDTLYGLKRSDYSFLKPYNKTIDAAVSTGAIQDAIDAVECTSGGNIDYIVASYKMRKQYVDYLSKRRTNVDYLTLDGGYKALSYSGIPFVADRFVDDDCMYLLNSSDFKLHQLCDWRWLEGDGGTVLHQVPDKACYSATLVKYADLLCERPMGQAKLTFKGVSADRDYFVVTFDSNGGSAVASQIVIPGGCAVCPTAPTKAGSSFAGWKRDGAAYNFSSPITSDTTLVASWS